METETILRAVEQGKLNDVREGIDEILLGKIANSLEEKRQSIGETLVTPANIEEEEDTKYQAFFRKALKKFGVESPADFKSDEEKKKFFDYVDKNYKGKSEKSEEIEEGNQFSRALRTARKEGKSKFTVDGKEYTVEDYDEEEED